jgi:hypothetical protein
VAERRWPWGFEEREIHPWLHRAVRVHWPRLALELGVVATTLALAIAVTRWLERVGLHDSAIAWGGLGVAALAVLAPSCWLPMTPRHALMRWDGMQWEGRPGAVSWRPAWAAGWEPWGASLGTEDGVEWAIEWQSATPLYAGALLLGATLFVWATVRARRRLAAVAEAGQSDDAALLANGGG